MASCGLFAQESSQAALGPEAQAFAQTYQQYLLQGISQLHLAYAQVAIFLATLFLLLNLRSLAFLALIGYGALILNVPFNIPTQFKYFFSIATIILGIVGLLARIFVLKRIIAGKK